MYLSPLPAEEDPIDSIRVADWIELNLLTGEEESISSDSATRAMAERPPDDSSTGEHRQEYSDNPEDLDSSELHDGYWRDAETTVEFAFTELRERSSCYGDRYPIRLVGETVEVVDAFESTEIAAFLALLRSRHLYRGALGDNGQTAGELFEELLPYALRRCLDTTEECSVRFGLAGNARGDGLPSRTDLALDELSRRIGEPRANQEDLRPVHDYGADAIAWKPLAGPTEGKLTIIGQATISNGVWMRKQPSPKWKSRKLIEFLVPPVTAVSFVEKFSINVSGTGNILGGDLTSIPLDRFRLLALLVDEEISKELRIRMKSWSEQMCSLLSA